MEDISYDDMLLLIQFDEFKHSIYLNMMLHSFILKLNYL